MPPRSNFWLWFFVLSIATLFHAYMWFQPAPLGLNGSAEVNEDAHKNEIVIDKVPDNANQDKKQVVQSSKAEEQKEAKDKIARFGGEFRNRVLKEMQSPNRGRFRQGGPATGGAETDDDKGEPGGPRMRDLMPFSSSPHGLPNDIEKGPETVLNTDPVLYASFINRIADEIYDAWVYYAKEAVQTRMMGKHGLESNLYVTKLEVEMNKSGEITGITILKHSGVEELDRAPEKAFWQVKSFPNPPEQMFDKDGFVRFEYEFHFELRSNFFGISPLNI